MKKISLILLLFLPTLCMAKDNEKSYSKLIKKYDLDSITHSTHDPVKFWDGVWRNNERFNNFMKAVEKGTPAIKKAFKELSGSELYLLEKASKFEVVATSKDSLLMPLYDELGAKISKDIKIMLVYDKELNACAFPNGNLYIYTGLLEDSLGFAGILGICAHEMAHYILQHSYVEAYMEAKRENNNKIAAGIIAGVQVASEAYAVANGLDTDKDALEKGVSNLFSQAIIDAHKFGFKYSREQEIEADIIAYRFLEAMGYGGENYIKVLQKIEDRYPDTYTSDTDDHPSTLFRIGLLQYMKAH